MNPIGFAHQFLRAPRQTGALVASGPQLCRLLARTAGVDAAEVILEFGTGTGAVTEEIARQKPDPARLIGIEINPAFAEVAQRRCPEAEIVVRSATQAGEVLAERGLFQCDAVVSGLPWAILPEYLQDELLDAAVQALRPGGRFATFAYVHGLPLPAAKRFSARLAEHFGEVERSPVVWANVPPAIVYRATTGVAATEVAVEAHGREAVATLAA
jgi:phospholipid N-methyltransferase